jgi:spore germination protein YaaH
MDSLSIFIDRFIRRLLIFFFVIATIVVGVPTIVILSQPHAFSSASVSPAKTVSLGKTKEQATPSHLVTFGWLVGNNSQLSSYNKLQVASPTFATIDASYNINVTCSPSTISNLHNEGKKVWARITLATQSDAATHQFLNNSKGIKQVIQEITDNAQKNHLDGLNLDIEQIPTTDRDAFSQFVMGLSKAIKQYHMTLSIDLQPESKDNQASLSSFNQQLGQYSDYIVFMGYDEHWSTDSTPGPVTSLQWLDSNIRQLIQTGIPPQKLLLGLPSYTRIWQVDQNGNAITSLALANEYVSTLMEQNNRHEFWDPTQAVYKISYTKNGNLYKVWLTNDRSLQAYFNLIDEYHIAGVGFWNLDMLSSTDWNNLVKRLNL